MLRIGASTLFSAGAVLVAFSACGGRTADAEQSNQTTGGALSPSTNTTMTGDQPGVGGSAATWAPTQSGGLQGLGGDAYVAMTTLTGGNPSVTTTALTGGTYGAGGVPTNIGGATMIAVGGTLCALAYNGQTYVTLVSPALCGNGDVEYTNGEQCDDGNQTSGDGCSNTCRVESNYLCGDGCRPCTATVVCGDGKIGLGEVCDDGNAIDGDGCNSTCSSIEPKWACYIPGKHCVHLPNCGDGILQPDLGEQCDEGQNNAPNHCGACTSTCTFGVRCGDGVVQPDCGEMCDDGLNTGAFGQCQPDCTMAPYCGDGIVQPDEQCDEGPNNGDAPCGYCTSSCLLGAYCGDGIVQPECGEACDEGTIHNDGAYGHCGANCAMPIVCISQTIYLDGGYALLTGCQD